MNSTADRQPDLALRLAKYLRDFVKLRTTTIRSVEKYDTVLWLGDMPREPDCASGAWTLDRDPEAPWLEVRKQRLEPPPAPPDVLQPWIDPAELRHAGPEMPNLLAAIQAPESYPGPTIGDTDPPPLLELENHSEVRTAYERYRPIWERWSTNRRRQEAIQVVYSELFRLHTQLRKQGEIIEVVLGLGLIDWRPRVNKRAIPIRRHAVVARAELEFDPARGVIRVVPPGEGAQLRLEDDMLEAELRPGIREYEDIEAQLSEIGDDIWDRERIDSTLRTWSEALDADSRWSSDVAPAPGEDARLVMSFAPAVILRKRPQVAMLRIYQNLIDQLSGDLPEVPQGWDGLTRDTDDETTDSVDRSDTPPTESAAVTPPEETYFPLPANHEQRRIVDAIGHHRGVLVQGPPGTGKSHTIANLICHLLATGQRVLVTAETARALRVLKDKLPEEIRPLCVSLLGQGGDAFAELNASIQGITTRQASYSPGAYDDRIADLDRRIDEARREQAAADAEIRSLRQDETVTHSLANGTYPGTASRIAERVAQERDDFGWLSLPSDASPEPALSAESVLDWLAILRCHTAEEIRQSELRGPRSSDLPVPETFAASVSAENIARAALTDIGTLRDHPAYHGVQAMPIDSRSQLALDLRSAVASDQSLRRTGIPWVQSALRDALAGRRARWDALARLTRERLLQIKPLLDRCAEHVVVVPSARDAATLHADAAAVLDHLVQGGRWKRLGFLVPRAVKGRTYLRTECTIDGLPADHADRLQVICDHLDIEGALSDLLTAWNDVGAMPEAHDPRLRSAEFAEFLSHLEACRELADGNLRLAQTMATATPPIPVPDWLDGEAGLWLEFVEAASVEDRYNEASEIINRGTRALEGLCELHDAHPVVQVLHRAIQERDVPGYSQAHATLLAAEGVRADLKRRAEIEDTLSTAAPEVVPAVVSSPGDDHWYERLAGWENAWRWAFTDNWLAKRTDFAYQDRLWTRRKRLEADINRLLGQAAALRAWTHFFGRLTPPQRNALKGWLEAVRRMPKTARSARAARLRQEARRYMDACRAAIPVWIMPRYLVAELVDAAPGRYDIVIVDESSQLGIESLFLFYIARKLVVVGDAEQISPYGVGISDEAVSGLQRQHLDGIPHRVALSERSSLYDNAKIRFSQNIVLREHFRCMPEIIQFSNDLCYASSGTPLDPLRAYPANRLKPLVLRHVPAGYRIGSTQHAQNPPEAEALVRQLAACLEDPRYEGKTMGVVSLQGEAQAKHIEHLLLESIEPEVIEERRLICGDAYAFQGDERDVMFLSMVAGPGKTRIGALADAAARRRFNVAVSRARDQLWLFHTATLDLLSDRCMRYRLLSYMLDPSRQTTEEEQQHFDSKFERDVYRQIAARGFHVRTQVRVGDPTNHRYRIDLVVEGMQGRLAVERRASR